MKSGNAIALKGMSYLLLSILAGPPCQSVAFAMEKGEATFLHALIVADTNDEFIGEDVKIDKDRFYYFLKMEIPEVRSRITIYKGSIATRQNILAYYRRLEVKPTESLLFFYAGHGIWRQDGHVLQLRRSTDILPRSELLNVMQAKGAQLTILITDTCSNYLDVSKTRDVPSVPPPPDPDPNVARSLFFRHRGVVDITAAKKGQEAFGDSEFGGLFTRALLDVMRKQGNELDRNRDSLIGWDEFMPRVKIKTQSNYEDLQRRSSGPRAPSSSGPQTPSILSGLAKPSVTVIPPTKWRLGIDTLNVAENGVLIHQVFRNTPAEWAGFQASELLSEINGIEIKNGADFARIIDESPRMALLKCRLRDRNTGKTRQITVRIDKGR